MGPLRKTIALIDRYTEACGSLLAWLALAMCLVTCAVVLLRYGFDFGSVATQESVTYMHAALFMLAAGFTFKRGGHVRVDIFYRRFSARGQAWVNAVGTVLFLLPFCVFVLLVSWPFVHEAWLIREASAEPGGLPYIYLLKTLIPLLAINLALQGLAELLRNALFLVEDY